MAKILKVRNATNDGWDVIASAVPDTSEFATIEYVDNEIENIDLSPYLTQSAASSTYLTQSLASSNYATKSYADNSASVAAAAIVDSAPATLNTLNELAAALGDDENFATSVTNSLSNKLDVSSASTMFQPLDDDLTQISNISGFGGFLRMDLGSGGNVWSLDERQFATTNNAELTGTTSIQEVKESVTIVNSAASGTIYFNILDDHAIKYYTVNATGSWTLYIRGNSSTDLNSILSIGQSITLSLMIKNGDTAYYNASPFISNGNSSIWWQNGTPTRGNANSIDVYTYTIIKTANNTYHILASQTKFGG